MSVCESKKGEIMKISLKKAMFRYSHMYAVPSVPACVVAVSEILKGVGGWVGWGDQSH